MRDVRRPISRRDIYRRLKRELRRRLLGHWRGKRVDLDRLLRRILRNLSRARLLRIARQPVIVTALFGTMLAPAYSGHADTIELADIALETNSSGFAIHGGFPAGFSGVSMSGAGDVNGDGFADVIIGASGNGPYGDYPGSAFVVFGRPGGQSVDLLDIIFNPTPESPAGFVISGATPGGFAGFSVSGAGDVNNDGMADLIIGNGAYSGPTYVVFGKASGDPVSLADIAEDDNPGGFVLEESGVSNFSGIRVSGGGDVNGDGLDDLLVGAPYSNVNGSYSGTSYVVFGKADGTAISLADIQSDGNSGGFAIHGAAPYDFAGRGLAMAGDVNNDGYSDIIVGAWGEDSNGNYSGASYVVFGKADGTAVELVNVALDENPAGFAIRGANEYDFSGYAVAGAGDVNGDGFADVIVGASGADSNGNYSGAGYIIFGKAGGAAVQLLELTQDNNSSGFALHGAMEYDNAGLAVSGAGDVNGDGLADVLVGARYADPNGYSSGASYLVFGKSDGSAVQLGNLAAQNNPAGFVLNGGEPFIYSGFSLAGAGDVDGDGDADVIIGAPDASPNGSYSGTSYVVFSSAFRASQDTVWVDFAFEGVSTGSFDSPFATVASAVAAVAEGGTIRIKGDSEKSGTSETPTIDKAMRVESAGGSVRIGELE